MLLRFLCALSLSIWVGGFTFYSAVVIPLLHYALGTLDTGFITERVTHTLNGAGGLTLALWWLAVWAGRSAARSRAWRWRVALRSATTLILAVLILLHRVMDGQIESGSFSASICFTAPV